MTPGQMFDVTSITAFLPRLLGAVLILVVGWIVAAIIASVVRGALRRTNLDDRMARSLGGRTTAVGAEQGISRAVYYLILVFVVVAALQTLGLTLITEPLNNFLSLILIYLPRVVGAAILLLVAWVLATVLRMIVSRVLAATRLDERLGEATSEPTDTDSPDASPTASATPAPGAPAGAAPRPPVSQTLADVVYWLVFLLFLPAILGALGLTGILEPVQTMLDRALGFLPNLVAAGVILVVGWFIARLVQRIVVGLLASVGIDGLGQRVGLGTAIGGQRLSDLVGLIVYVLIFIPILVAALNALALEAVTRPISNMLNNILAALPNIFAAALILAISYFIGRLVAGLVTNILAGMGFDRLPSRLGLTRAPDATNVGGQSPSQLVGSLVLVAIMLFAALEAAQFLGFGLLAELIAQFLVFAGQILMGLIVFAIALYLSNLAANLVRSSGAHQAGLLALAARVSVLVLGGAMALRQMGLANEIINLAFGLLLGAVALATALAFGLGGREVAGEELRGWRNQVKVDESEIALPPGAAPTTTPGPTTPARPTG